MFAKSTVLKLFLLKIHLFFVIHAVVFELKFVAVDVLWRKILRLKFWLRSILDKLHVCGYVVIYNWECSEVA